MLDQRMCYGQENGQEARPLRKQHSAITHGWPLSPLFLASPPETSFLRQTSDTLWDQFLTICYKNEYCNKESSTIFLVSSAYKN